MSAIQYSQLNNEAVSKMARFERAVIVGVVALSTMAVIIGGAVTLVLNFTPLYAADIDTFGLTEVSGLTKDQLMENYRALTAYNNVIGTGCLNLPDFSMSETGRIHFYEVRRIFIGLQIAALAGALVLTAAALFVKGRDQRSKVAGAGSAASSTEYQAAGTSAGGPQSPGEAAGPAAPARPLGRGMAIGAGATLVLPALLAAACAASWDTTFVTFHKIFFNNEYWIFDADTDPIITVLPDAFFLHCAIAIFVLIAAASSLILAGHILGRPRTPFL